MDVWMVTLVLSYCRPKILFIFSLHLQIRPSINKSTVILVSKNSTGTSWKLHCRYVEFAFLFPCILICIRKGTVVVQVILFSWIRSKCESAINSCSFVCRTWTHRIWKSVCWSYRCISEPKMSLIWFWGSAEVKSYCAQKI